MPEIAAEQYQDLGQQAQAARLGLWTFLASESLLFAGLFGLYGALRWEHPAAVRVGIAHAVGWAGALNTGILLTSSWLAALALHALRERRALTAALYAWTTAALGLVFIAIKGYEYHRHLAEGLAPGGRGAFFREHTEAGLPLFANLYYLMTGLHALHVLGGATALAVIGWLTARRRIGAERAHVLEGGVLYWHLVDAVWVFLWPLFYLATPA